MTWFISAPSIAKKELNRTLGFVVADHSDSADVTLVVGEWFSDKGIDDLQANLRSVHAATDGDNVCIVVLTSKLCGLDAPR